MTDAEKVHACEVACVNGGCQEPMIASCERHISLALSEARREGLREGWNQAMEDARHCLSGYDADLRTKPNPYTRAICACGKYREGEPIEYSYAMAHSLGRCSPHEDVKGEKDG
jgi:hypothetical protein